MSYQKLIQKAQVQRKGWSDFRLPLYDFSERWQWWSLVTLTNNIPPLHILPYPKIAFNLQPQQSSPQYQMIEKCCSFNSSPNQFSLLLDWLLYKFGDNDVQDISYIPSQLAQKWEENFCLKTLLSDPSDWFGIYYERNIISKHEMDKNGLFCTPLSVVSAMVEMTLKDADLLSSVDDPCVGSGRMLLLASNYSLFLSGQDINMNMVKITKINGWLYMPSLVWPCKSLSAMSKFQVNNHSEKPQITVVSSSQKPVVDPPVNQQITEPDIQKDTPKKTNQVANNKPSYQPSIFDDFFGE